MIIQLGQWNDREGAGSICSLTMMMENLDIFTEDIEDSIFQILIDFHGMEFIHPKENDD